MNHHEGPLLNRNRQKYTRGIGFQKDKIKPQFQEIVTFFMVKTDINSSHNIQTNLNCKKAFQTHKKCKNNDNINMHLIVYLQNIRSLRNKISELLFSLSDI